MHKGNYFLFNTAHFECYFVRKIFMAKIEIIGVIGQNYFYSDFLTDYANAKQQGLIELQINSLGGSVVEGFAIADFIKLHSADFLSVTNIGNIASIATTIFFALPFEKRTYDINKGFFVIHNPFVPNEAIENTTAQGLSDASEKLREIEDKIVIDIVKATGADKEAVKALMIVDKPLTIEQIKAFNIANVEELRVVAFFNPDNNNKNEMNKNEVEEIVSKANESLLDKIKAVFTKKIMALSVTDAEGNQVNFPDVEEGTELKVGDKAEGNVNGDVLLADGRTLVMVDGVIAEIKEKVVEEEEAPNQELEEAKAKIADLEKQLQAKVVALKNIESKVVALKADPAPSNEEGTKTRKLNEYLK